MTTQTDTTHTYTTLTGSPQRLRLAGEQRPSYDSVPFFRKRWLITVLFLAFIPAMIVLCLTGPVYQNDNGKATEWTNTQRYQAAIGGALFMAIGLLRLFVMPAS